MTTIGIAGLGTATLLTLLVLPLLHLMFEAKKKRGIRDSEEAGEFEPGG